MNRIFTTGFLALTLVFFACIATGEMPTAAKPVKPATRTGGIPVVSKPVMFNTKEADAIVSKIQIFPPDNPWNEDISKLPVHPHSSKIVASIGANDSLACNIDMGFIIIPPNQKNVPINIRDYAAESDPGPHPIPNEAPIEGWPALYQGRGSLALDKLQRAGEGDRHVIVVDPYAMRLYEMFGGFKTEAGWSCAQVSMFDLSSNTLRPDSWTSADAAGLPIFPAAVRFSECEKGMVTHAMRFTVRRSKKAYVYPATHHAGQANDEDLPRMGERFRLRKDFDISGLSPHAKAIAKGLKKYGMFVADNGSSWRISVTPDERFKDLNSLQAIKGRDLEVVLTTGPKEGPRAPGAPAAKASAKPVP